MASIRTRTSAGGKKKHQAQVRVKGSASATKTFVSKTDANRWALQTEADIQSGMFIRQSQAMARTVNDLVDEYLRTVSATRRRGGKTDLAGLAYWRKNLGPYALGMVTPKLIEDHRDRLALEITVRKTQRAPATVLRYLMLLSHAFSTAIHWQWCERNPVDLAMKPKVANRRVRYLRGEERDRLLAACRESTNKDLYLAVMLALSTGMRQGEIMGMRWSALVFYEDRSVAKLVLSAGETKNGTARSVVIAATAFRLLQLRRAAEATTTAAPQPSGLVFPSRTNPARPVDLRAPWEAALMKAGLSDFRFHDLRHTAASYMAMDGATTLEIKEALGHKSTAMAERYSHLSQSHVDEVVMRMNSRHFGIR